MDVNLIIYSRSDPLEFNITINDVAGIEGVVTFDRFLKSRFM